MHWNISSIQPKIVSELVKGLGIHTLTAKTLVSKNIQSIAEAKAFIQPDLMEIWQNTEIIDGLQNVCEHLEQAIKDNRRIVVFGDYDVDGISASTLLLRALKEFGLTAQAVLPLRNGEGYGLTPAALERIYQLAPDVVVTVDCGVSAADEVKLLQQQGIDVIITDHHEGGDNIPENVPIADPKLQPGGPSFNLAGVGVVLKLVDLLGQRFDKPDLWKSFTDLAALGTIADQMPLSGENRALVYEGIKLINSSPRAGIAAVQAISNKQIDDVSASNLTYGLIPRLNAAGRISDPLIALKLLLTDDPLEAMQIAQDLEILNQERRALEAQLTEQAIAQADTQGSGRKVTVVGGDGWHDGVKGIVASRLVRNYGVPAIVFSIEGDEAVGSGRSVGKINLYQAVAELSDMLIRFGGHEGAVGVSLPTDRLDDFRDKLESVLEREPEDSFYPALKIDAIVRFSELDIAAVEELKLLEPFGNSNNEPVYLAENVSIKYLRVVGADGNHLSFKVSDSLMEFSAIWFNCPNVQEVLNYGQTVDLVFSVQVETWRERKQVKLHVIDLQPHQSHQRPHQLPHQPLNQFAIIAKEQPADLDQRIAQNLLNSDDAILHNSQLDALAALEQKQNTLAIMATGRGKSLIFQIQAVKLLLTQQKQSIFVYPLRALINDQEFGLSHSLESFGLKCASLTGATAAIDRDRIYQQFNSGELGILLTTPEFLLFHQDRLLTNQNVGFVVIDEAHHIASSSKYFRPLYTKLELIGQKLPTATLLAVTATADQDTTTEISSALDIDKIVIDQFQRTNLLLDDQRNIKDREHYLANIIANSSKAIVYVNSKDTSIQVAKTLRKLIPQNAHKTGFYNAGLTKEDRIRVEAAFRDGTLDYMIATSAFGEGVNIPNVRDLVLYDLPFSIIDFNQMSGRAGRDGLAATIHLLSNQQDAAHNSRILNSVAPNREFLAILWRAIINLQSQLDSKKITAANHDQYLDLLFKLIQKLTDDQQPEFATISTGLLIFSELGLIEDLGGSVYNGVYRVINRTDKARVDLQSSAIYLEGQETLQSFDNFKNWLSTTGAKELLSKLQKPLLPTD